MSKSPTIVWFRTNLRLADQPALDHAEARKAALAAYGEFAG